MIQIEFQSVQFPRSAINWGKRHISILSTRNVIWTLLWRSPHPPLETSRTFFDTAEAPGALFIVQALRFSAVSKTIKVHLGQGQDLIVSIQIYFQYKYAYENAGFCILCINVLKMLKTIEIFHDFHRETSQAPTPPPPPHPQRPSDVSREQNRYVTLPYSLEGKQYNSDNRAMLQKK